MSQAGALNNNGGGGGGTADIQKINVQTGTSPVVTTNNTITFNGAVVAAGTNPVRTDGIAPATMALEVQTAQAIASTDATKIGLAAFNSADFTVDANGFVSTIGGGGITTIDGDTGSVTGATVSLKGNATAGSSVDFVGSGTAMTFNVTDASNNTYIGASSGPGSIPGVTNTAFGYNTLTSLSSGSDNVAIGANALNSLSSGSENCAIGNTCCQHLSSGIWNVLLGSAVMRSATSGSHNVAMGTISLINLSSGSYNTVFGDSAGTNYTGSESSNILLSNAGVVSESNVIHIGTQGTGNGQQNACFVAGINNTNSSGFTSPLPVFVDSSTGQLGFGSSGGSGISTINGDSGSATGSTVTLNANSNSGSSVNFAASGSTVDLTVTDASFNTIIGTGAGNGSITGFGNTMLGYQTFVSAAGDINNIGIGYQALNGATNSLNNVAVGNLSMSTAGFSGIRNVAIGNNSGQSFTNGSNNTACGYGSLSAVNSGGHNTALGEFSLASLTTGSNNIAIGISSTNGGTAYTSSESNNIVIGNPGTVGESNILRIGTQGSSTGQQNKCYIAGIEAATYSAGSPKPALTYCDTSDGQLVSTQAVGSSTATSTFGSLVVGTGRQNTANYAILVNVSIVVTAATSATITMGIGSTSTPTTNTMITTFTVAAASTYSFSGFVPAGYYMLVNTTGTITVGSITTQSCAVG